MKTIKTIVENKHLAKIKSLLDNAGVLDSTVEEHDLREKNVFKKLFRNKYTVLITTCTENQKSIIVSKVFPMITLFGGICIA